MNSTINAFVNSSVAEQVLLQMPKGMSGEVTGVIIPFKDQKSADIVKSQLKDLSVKLKTIQPVFTSHKIFFFHSLSVGILMISEELPTSEPNPSLINQTCVVHEFQCDRCDAG